MSEPDLPPLLSKAQSRLYRAQAAFREVEAKIADLEKVRERYRGEISASEDIIDLIAQEAGK